MGCGPCSSSVPVDLEGPWLPSKSGACSHESTFLLGVSVLDFISREPSP